jgi:uncharacterized membrane protein
VQLAVDVHEPRLRRRPCGHKFALEHADETQEVQQALTPVRDEPGIDAATPAEFGQEADGALAARRRSHIDGVRLVEVSARQPEGLEQIATRRFSTLGVSSVVTLLVTGLINAWFLVGRFPALLDSLYGRLVSTEVALFVIIVSIAAFNRVKLTPRLTADGNWDDLSQSALERLWRNVIVEICLGAIILASVGGLGTTPPPIHKHGPVQHHMYAGAANQTS